jgi:flavin-dependent dehydrogenase
VNVGLGGKAETIKARPLRLQDYWNRFVQKLASEGLVDKSDYEPSGYSYYLRGRADTVRRGNAFIVGDAVGLASVDMGEGIGPAVQSALLAAHAIASDAEYDLASIGQYSVPGFFRNKARAGVPARRGVPTPR